MIEPASPTIKFSGIPPIRYVWASAVFFSQRHALLVFLSIVQFSLTRYVHSNVNSKTFPRQNPPTNCMCRETYPRGWHSIVDKGKEFKTFLAGMVENHVALHAQAIPKCITCYSNAQGKAVIHWFRPCLGEPSCTPYQSWEDDPLGRDQWATVSLSWFWEDSCFIVKWSNSYQIWRRQVLLL